MQLHELMNRSLAINVLVALSGIVSLFGFAAPAHSADPDPIDFAHDVVPILRKHCIECHGGDNAEGGMSLNTRSTLLDAAAVAPGRADESRIIELVTSRDPDDQMPPQDRDRLTDDEVQVLRSWINAGALWEEGFTFAENRYEPPLHPRSVELPPAQNGRTNPVDRILDAYLAERDLPPCRPIDDRTFIRRVSLDLIGLLPEPEQVEVFIADERPDKRDRLIRQLLDQDREFAEHWLTFWNDLLRNAYAGTGFIDDGRRQITSWLYEALLTNKPYDEFVRELVAPEPEAAGFIRGIKWRGNVNSSQATEIQFAQSLGQVFLGINMKCASCHDSFIDRWTLDETYNLAAVYATEALEVHRCDVPSGRFAQAAWIFPELGSIDASAEQPERLRQLADLMTHPENGRLTRTIVNRLWHRLMGRGIVHPVDAMQTEPWNADLLDFLATDLAEHDYNLKHILAVICQSQAYQSQAVVADEPASPEEYVFTGPLSKRMTAEQFVDAIYSLADTWPEADGGAFRRDGRGQGGQLADVIRAEERAAAKIPLEELINESIVRAALEQSSWIWNNADFSQAAPGGAAHLRDTSVWEDAEHVLIVCAADNGANIFVNGQRLALHKGFDRVLVAEATHHRRAGENIIAARVENDGEEPNPAGILLTVVGLSERGDVLWVRAIDERARVTGEASGGWEQPEYDDAAWSSAVVVGDAASEPWKLLETFSEKAFTLQRDWDSLWSDRPVRASHTPGDRLQETLGRPNREQVVTSRPSQLTTLEAISLSNGEDMARMLNDAAKQIIAQHEAASASELADWLYLAALSRPPTPEETSIAADLLGSPPSVEGVEDLLWSVVMLPEFQLIR